MRALPGLSAVLAISLVAGAGTSALGAAGDVVTTYGTGGTVAAPGFLGYQAMGSELDSQGRLLMASGSSQGLAVNRISAAGAFESGFGSGGTALASVDPSYPDNDVIAVDSQDRALLASYTFNGTSSQFEELCPALRRRRRPGQQLRDGRPGERPRSSRSSRAWTPTRATGCCWRAMARVGLTSPG
ncbi:MAG: hypothetical protein U0R78_14060 [Nocardioidaceae bacterium]